MMHENENATMKPIVLYNQYTLIKWIELLPNLALSLGGTTFVLAIQ